MGIPRIWGNRNVPTGLPIAGRGDRSCSAKGAGSDLCTLARSLGTGTDTDSGVGSVRGGDSWNLGSCDGGGGDWSAEMALSASAVVSPRLPIFMLDEPYLYIQPGPQPPSSCCSGSSCARSFSRRRPTTLPANTRMASASASPAAPVRSRMRVRRRGASRACRVESEVARSSCEAKKRKHSAVS